MNPETETPIEATEKKTRKPRQSKVIATAPKGYTKVAEGTGGIFDAAQKWSKDQVRVENNAIYVRNDFINWEHYIGTDEYIPASEGVTRSAVLDLNAPALDANGMPTPQVA